MSSDLSSTRGDTPRVLFVVLSAAAIVVTQILMYAAGRAWWVMAALDMLLVAMLIVAAARLRQGLAAAAVLVPSAAVALRFIFAASGHRATTLGAVVDLVVGIPAWGGQAIAFTAFVLVVAYMLLRGPTESRVWWITIGAVLLLLSIPIDWPPTFR